MKSVLRNALKIWIIVCVGSFLLPAAHSFAQNMIIEQGKTDGLIGEAVDGYIGFRMDVPDGLRREVSKINLERKAAYTELAEQNQVSIEVAAALTAEKLIARAGENHWVRDANGHWGQR